MGNLLQKYILVQKNKKRKLGRKTTWTRCNENLNTAVMKPCFFITLHWLVIVKIMEVFLHIYLKQMPCMFQNSQFWSEVDKNSSWVWMLFYFGGFIHLFQPFLSQDVIILIHTASMSIKNKNLVCKFILIVDFFPIHAGSQIYIQAHTQTPR